MKVGLKETLTLISKGYTKKEIEALADIDAEIEKEAEAEPEAEPAAAPEASADPVTEEVDYKKLYEELMQKNKTDQEELKKKDETIKKIQQDNVNKNILPDIEQNNIDNMNSLKEALRSFY